MALPTGTFNSARTGWLQVVFSGRWLVDGAEWAAGADDLVLRCYVGEGADRRTAMLSVRNPTATIELDYTAGTDVAVGMEYVSHDFDAADEVAALDLRIACHVLPPAPRPRVLRFADLLQQLKEQLQPMSLTPQTPRWLPDSTGNEWFVRPLAAMATVDNFAQRFLSVDTGQVNHPLPTDRTVDPIDPDSVMAEGFDNKTWSGLPVTMATEVLSETVTFPPTRVYYIRATAGPPDGTANLYWRSAPLASLDGSTYATAWPGLAAVDWSVIQPGDTLWVCGTHLGAGLTVQASGTAGAYIKIRLDHATDPGRIDKAAPITSAWTAEGSEWWTPLADVSDCMLYEDEVRLRGCNIRSRCRGLITAVNADADTITFSNIRRVDTGSVIDIASDFVGSKLPAGLSQNTRYYAIVVSSPWISSPSTTFYGVLQHTYVVKLAASYADAIAGTAIDLGPRGSEPPPNAFVFVRQTTAPFFDPVPGELDPGEYAVDVVQQRLYYRPTTGTPAEHDVRVSAETYGGDAAFGAVGSCIYGINRSYIKVLGGGEYGGLFADTPAPAGRLGLGNSNAIEFDTGQHIVVDGVLIDGGRSGVAFKNVQFGTVRNSRIRQCAHHSCGGEELTGTQEPDLLLERNWISEIGNLHEFGDAQALVTNPHCDRAIFRRNYVFGLGQNIKVSTPAAVVFDGSPYCSAYLNWFDYCYGRTVNVDAGNGEPAAAYCVAAMNIVTRQGQGQPRDENLIQRVGFLHVILNGVTDPGVIGLKVFGNLIAWTTIGNRAPDTLDDCGLVYQRSNNNAGSGSNELAAFNRNAIFSVDGPVWAAQKNASAAQWPTRTADRNLYAGTPEWGIRTSGGTFVQTWTGAQIQGLTAGNWTADTGNDIHSELAVLHPADTPRGPTLEELEILRLYDEFDTYDQPTESLMGSFPFADVLEE